MLDVGEGATGIAIVLQTVAAIALIMRRGNRLMHQLICVVTIVALITSVSTIITAPGRLQSLCISPLLPSEVSLASVAVQPGG